MTAAGEPIGRWRLVAEAPGERSVARWRAVDAETGEPAELLVLRPGAPDRIASFTRTHQLLQGASAPGLVRTRALVDHQGQLHVVREPLLDGTLAELRLPLAPLEVAWLGHRLGPAVLAAGAATGGAFDPRDVGFDAAGMAVLAPRGRAITRVDLGLSRAVAPEVLAGRPPDGRAGLYGLGVWMYRALTGRAPSPDRPPTLPSSLRGGIPPALDAAILQLLDAEPARRPGALPLLAELDAPPAPFTPDRPSEAPVTTTALAVVRPSAPAAFSVVLPAAALRALDAEARGRTAALAGVSPLLLDRLGAAELPLVLESGSEERAVTERHAELVRAGHAAELLRPARWWPWAALLTGTGTAVTAGGLAALLLLVALVPVALPLAVVALAGAALAAAGGLSLRRTAGRRASLADGLRLVDEDRASRATSGPVGRLWERVRRARAAIADAGLPAAAAADLRSALKEVEQRLEGLAEGVATADRALAEVDLPRLRARAEAAVRRGDPEGDRLTRTLGDVEAIGRTRADALAEVDALEDAVDAILATAGRAAAELDELVSTARPVPRTLSQ